MALVAVVAHAARRARSLRLVLGADFAAEPGAFRLVMLGALANSFTTMLYPCLSAQGLARWGIAAFALGSARGGARVLPAHARSLAWPAPASPTRWRRLPPWR